MDFRTVYTTCSYCGCGCGMLLEVLDDEVVGTLPVKTHPVSEGSLCIKGWNIHEFIESERRLTKPLLRQDGKLKVASWDEALDAAAQGLKKVIDTHGPDAVADPGLRQGHQRRELFVEQVFPGGHRHQ